MKKWPYFYDKEFRSLKLMLFQEKLPDAPSDEKKFLLKKFGIYKDSYIFANPQKKI